MVPENSSFFCSTMATLSRSTSRSYFRTSMPPTFKVPSLTSYRRGISCTKVVLLEPVPPRMPTVAPEGMCRFTSFSARCLAVVE